MNTGVRPINYGQQFDQFFRAVKGDFQTIANDAVVTDTLSLMREVIVKRAGDTAQIAHHLKGQNDYETCRSIWNFCFKNLQYKKDEPGIEQVRSPARAWADRKNGVDCDCMTVFVCSILHNLGIPFIIRITGYSDKPEPEFTHVYPVALLKNKEVILDCVVHQFNYEVPYTIKKDITMKLQFLDGFNESNQAGDLFGEILSQTFNTEELGLLFGGDNYEHENFEPYPAESLGKIGDGRFKERVKNTLNKINRVNPVTSVLRLGILAAMKTNLLNVASALRYSYLSPQQAIRQNIDMAKFPTLVAIRQKAEKVYFGAGGKPTALRHAILSGRGNRDRRVALDGFDLSPAAPLQSNSVYEVIGQEIFDSEFEAGAELSGLGEPITATAAMAAASGFLATLKGLLKQIGGLFKKGSPEAIVEAQGEKETLNEQAGAIQEITAQTQDEQAAAALKLLAVPGGKDGSTTDKTAVQPATQKSLSVQDQINRDESLEPTPTPQANTATNSNPTSTPPPTTTDKKGVLQWVQDNPGKTAAIGAGIALLAYAGYKLYQHSQNKALNGLDEAGKTKKKKNKKSAEDETEDLIRRLELL